ncbi:signal peptide peptidase SppA [Blastochloris viridis]|uniref:Putative protease sohB n=1 Tax=Blastochloris viridis TaxID=1079 RepID=A0A0H5BAN6_BLAVI|nr:signal peptide peptidase SppA [Blastochloris viridis]ALK10783.1 Putative signal peptide peptidase SppA [Blastochloris viridis]BAR99250.1 signal peptide peptidase SppA [Blastochloris viridis]CUU43445.1 putative protease sohB [Blastochloris viridis]
MSFDADTLIERRRLRRSLSAWRIAAVLAVAAAVGALVVGLDGASFVEKRQAHIARVPISGLIRGDRDRLKMLDEIATSGAKAVILAIDSPGGTVTGSDGLHTALRRLAEKRPVVAVVDGMAASGAYIAALGADEIIAGRNSLVGSIGVIVQFPNVTGLLKSVGVEVEEVKSTPLKAAPSGLVPTSPEARQALQSVVDDSYGWFKSLVKARRDLDDAELRTVADGRVWTGAQALELKLIDRLGDQDTALAWLNEARGVDKSLPVRDWKGSRSATDEIKLTTRVLAALAEAAGWPQLAQNLRTDPVALSTALDGVLAVWHPPVGQ